MNGADERFTLDSNILIYSVDGAAGPRYRTAIEIVDQAVNADCWLTLQSLSEFYVAVSRKRIMRAAEAAAQVGDWLAAFRSAAVCATAIHSALADSLAERASYWDALLVATAASAGCTLILTEDLQDGSRLAGVEIHNPFAPDGRLTPRTRQLLGV
jgi:predicted nucleic acid-binding protein